MALDFNISASPDCSKITYNNCSTYCDNPTYTYNICKALITNYEVVFVNTATATSTLLFYGGADTTGTITSWSWVYGAQTSSSQNFTCDITYPNTSATRQNLSLTVVDSNGLTSTVDAEVELNSSGQIEAIAIARVTFIPSANPTTQYIADDTLYFNISGYPHDNSIVLQTGDGDFYYHLTLPANHTYDTTGTFNIEFDTIVAEFNSDLDLTFQYQLTSDGTDCTDELTEDNITEVLLSITSPDNTTESVDITDDFLNAPFDILQTDLDTVDLSLPGIWNFETIVTKTDGSNYTFTQCKAIVLKCDLDCRYSKLLASLINLENCLECKQEKQEIALQVSLLMDALKDHIGCHDTAAINRSIELIEVLLANQGCSC